MNRPSPVLNLEKAGDAAVIPSHLQVEIVGGICNLKCIMCPIEKAARRGIMDIETFKNILDRFSPYKEHFRFLSLFGLGEPLLDKTLVDKVKLAKEMGFRGLGFATNAEPLNEKLSLALIEAGLDTIIFSVDGVDKKTHEAIRTGSDFDRIIENINRFIDLRNSIGHTKIIVRMILQELNKNQTEDYQSYWSHKLSKEHDDQVAFFEVHDGGACLDENRLKERQRRLAELSQRFRIVCPDLHERIIVLLDGRLQLCCGDEKISFELGNVLQEDPIKLYNNSKFLEFREKMQQGKINEIDFCKNCQLLISRLESSYLNL